MTTPVDTIKISLKGSPSEISVWDGMTLSDVRQLVAGVKSTMVCMGREVGATASTQLTDQTVVCKNGQAVYTRLTFAQGGESNNETKGTKMKTLPVTMEKQDRKSQTNTVKSFNNFLTRGAIAFNRYHELVENPKADKGNLAIAVAGETQSLNDAVASLQNIVSTLPNFGSQLATEAVENDTSALTLEILPKAVRVFKGKEEKGDFEALKAYMEV